MGRDGIGRDGMRAGSEPGHKECEGSTGETGGDRDEEE